MTIKTFYALNNVNFYRDGTYENIIRGWVISHSNSKGGYLRPASDPPRT